MYFTDKLDDIVTVLNRGGVILYPTDTIWGLGCDATNELAVNRVYQLKGREKQKPLILLVSDIYMLKRYIKRIHPRIETLLAYHTHPLTIIYEASENLPAFNVSENGTVGIRIVQDVFCKKIISRFNKPVVSTSANKSDDPHPICFGEISSDIIKNVDYVVKYRQNDKSMNPPSVVACFNDKGDLEFLRT